MRPGAKPKIRNEGAVMAAGGKPPAAGGWGSGGKAPSAQKFCILLQKNLILGLF